MREHGLELAAEDEQLARGPVVQRLLAEPVAAEDQPLAVLVPDGEREHPIEPAGQRHGVVVLREVGDDLGVAVRGERVAAGHELFPKLAEVVDLAVERHPDRAVLGADRRVAVDEIDDRQAVLRDDGARALEGAGSVRATVVQEAQLLVDDVAAQGLRRRRHDPQIPGAHGRCYANEARA